MRTSTGGASETEAVAAGLADELRPGDVVLIEGELGAGKTTFVRGAAQALGVSEPVTSPTFTVGQLYALPEGSSSGPVIAHLDLYRLESLGDEEPELLADYFGSDRISFVEWPAAGEGSPELERVRARVSIEHADGDRRRIVVEVEG